MTKPSIVSRWPQFDDEQLAIVNDVLKSGKVNYWTGSHGNMFEREFADFVGVDHAIALANGTVALELALMSIDIGQGDEVIVPARTFIASASCVVARGGVPVVADVDLESQNLTRETIEDRLTSRTKAIICVHLAGRPCEMDPIMELAKERGLWVIEDCAQAHGATYRGRPVGSLGDLAAFSFCQDKIMSTGGEGGMMLTRDTHLWKRAWSYKDHGKSYDAVHNKNHPPGFRWLHESFGTNWRMTEMQAALGRIQLKRLPEWVDIRRRNSAKLDECCRGIHALRTELVPSYMGHSYYRYYAFVQPEKLPTNWTRDLVIEKIKSYGVPCFSGSCGEIYREKTFQGLHNTGRLPGAQELNETSLAFLVDHTLTEKDIQTMGQAIRSCFASEHSTP